MNNLKTIRATALVVSMAFATGSSMALAADKSSSMTEAVSDSWITTKVKTELVTSEGVPGTDMKVTTVDGVVTLVGVLSSQAEVDKAVALTQGVKGVKSVDSAGLKVGDAAGMTHQNTKDQKDQSAGEVIDDTWITTKVKADLATTKGIPSTDIKVVTEDGVVTLSGTVDSQMAVDKAVATTRAIDGVKQVNADALVVGK